MAEFRIETERLILRDWHDEDWAEVFRLTNTPAVMRWLGQAPDPAGQEDMRRRMETFAERYGHCLWLVERKPDGGHLSGEVLGFCGLKRADAPDSTIAGAFEIGWRLREDAWGRGYAREAAIASLQAGFERFEAEEIFAITVIENDASWVLMKRLGMRRRQDLDYLDPRYEPPLRDTVVYSIAREEWAAA